MFTILWKIMYFASLIIAVLMIINIQRKLIKPLNETVKLAETLAEGDLTVKDLEVKSKDEIGKLASVFNLMKNNIAHLVKGLHESANQLSAASEELSASAEEVTASVNEIAVGAESAAFAIDMITAAMEEQTATMEQVNHVALELTENAAQLQSEVQQFRV